MRVCVNPGVDADADMGALLQATNGSQLFLAFGVDENITVQGKCQFFLCFPDTGEDHAVGGTTGVQRCLDLSPAYRVGPDIHAEDEREECRVCVGLDGVVE